jgi:hypothetical protein
MAGQLQKYCLGLACVIFTCGSTVTAQPGYDEAVEPYVAFIEQGQADPVDYVMGLFERHDLVILCERFHPEATQWDFIYDLVSDSRFIADVGNIYTEYGTVDQQANLDDFILRGDGLSEHQINGRAVHLMRNLTIWPVWDNTNFYDYLKKLYWLNQSLPQDDRIQHHFTDGPVDWELIKAEGYGQFQAEFWPIRDRAMAENIIRSFRAISASGATHRKALVIMNYRHAFGPIRGSRTGELMGNCAEYLFEAFGDRTANVLINSVAVEAGSNNEMLLLPVHDGQWDAAFAATGDRSAGFDFAGSPMGADAFDMFPKRLIHSYRYQDVFTGFVFYLPLQKHVFADGIPGLFDEDFTEEFLARSRAISQHDYDEAVDYLATYEITTQPATYGEHVFETVDQWLTVPTAITGFAGTSPIALTLEQNYPNPFNGATVICFSLPQADVVELVVYDLLGQQVATLLHGTLPAGTHMIPWHPRDEGQPTLASGTYLYRLQTEGGTQTRRMLLLR